jgi:hypothetical protein
LERLKYSTITNNIFHLFTKFLYLYLTMAAQVPIQAQAQVPPAVQPAVQPQVQFLLWNVATALATVGFTAAQVAILQAESFPTLESFRTKTEEMIQNLAKSMESRRANQNRVPFGLARIERTIALMHWIQDHYRMGENPNHHGPNDFDDNAIVEALENAQFRESLKESSKIASDAADPGKFAKGMDWFQWYRQFQNYMSCIPGTTGIPLAYVIRPNDAPIIDPNATYAMHLINRAPLVGRVFDTDKQHAHQILVGHLTEDTTAWIATVVDQKNARLDVHALRRFYEGDGNVSRRITEGDRLRETLHYKSEKAMTFSDFVQKSNRMFMIYEQEEGRPWLESQKITWLFKAISGASHLAGLKSSLEVKLGEGTLTYEFAVNHIISHLARNNYSSVNDAGRGRSLVSQVATGSGGGRGGGAAGRNNYRGGRGGGAAAHGKSGGGGGSPGNSATGKKSYVSKAKWNKMSQAEKDKFIAERKANKKQRTGGSDGDRAASEVGVSSPTTAGTISPGDAAMIASAIAAIKIANVSSVDSGDGSAGNAFGGKSEAARNKRGRDE